MAMTITELVKEFVKVRTERLELEKKADEIKKGREAELKQMIMAEFSAQGLKSANVQGVGRVVCKTTYHYEVKDLNMLAYQQLKMLVQAGKEGRPLSDGLILQSRINAGNLEDAVIQSGGSTDNPDTMAAYGLVRAGREDLSFTRGA